MLTTNVIHMKTKKVYEAHLNELYTDCYSAQQAWDAFCYLKQGKIKYGTVNRAYIDHTLGSLLENMTP